MGRRTEPFIEWSQEFHEKPSKKPGDKPGGVFKITVRMRVPVWQPKEESHAYQTNQYE